jgi:multidrug efflux pump subunit AcrA (membrane-fusion protein)
LKKQTSMQLDLLEKQYQLAKAWYETAKQTYEQYKAMSEWKVNEVGTKFEVAKQQYEEAIKGLEALKKQKQAQLSQIKSQINQVKWNKNLAAVSLWNIKLFAPYNGVITQKMANIWQVVGAGMPIFQIADETKLKAVFYVPVQEVSSIKEWQKVILEALWTTLTWTISLIYPSADMYSKKIPVEVKLSWTAPKNWKLGMYISWYPISEKITGLVIPQEFLHYEYGKAYVYKKENDTYKKTYIQIWKCDNNYCIVKEWLKINEIIK